MTDSDGFSTTSASLWHQYQQMLERDKALAFLVKVKARSQQTNPGVFTSVAEVLLALKSAHELPLSRRGDDTRMFHEVENLKYTVTALLAHDHQLVVDFQYFCRRKFLNSWDSLIPVRLRVPGREHRGFVTSHDRDPRQRVADLVEKMRLFCEDGGWERYERCMATMSEYLQDVIDFCEFMRRILSLDSDKGLRMDFISQFCGDTDYL